MSCSQSLRQPVERDREALGASVDPTEGVRGTGAAPESGVLVMAASSFPLTRHPSSRLICTRAQCHRRRPSACCCDCRPSSYSSRRTTHDASLEVAVTPGQEVSRRGKSVLSSGGAVGEEAGRFTSSAMATPLGDGARGLGALASGGRARR